MESIAKTNTFEALSNDLTGVVEKINRSVVAVDARRHLSSSGVYWRSGIIVTAAHTIRRSEDISVVLSSGQIVAASLAGADQSTDLAVLKIDSEELAVPQFGDAAQLRVGHLVLAIGRGAQRGLNATLGIVGVLNGAWRSWRGGLIDQFIGLDLDLRPGVAGGPLVDAHARVLGINTAALYRNIAVAVPGATVNRVIERLLEKGHMNRGYLGLGMQPIAVPAELKNELNLSADIGLLVVSVDPEGPGRKAGILFGDVIVNLAGTVVRGMRDLQAFIEPESVGQTIEASLIRGGQPIKVNVTIGERKRKNS